MTYVVIIWLKLIKKLNTSMLDAITAELENIALKKAEMD